MASRNNWNNLTRRMAPERRGRIDQGVGGDLADMLLSEDMQISTLRRIVEALGGELEIIAHLPAGRIALSQFMEPRRRSGARTA